VTSWFLRTGARLAILVAPAVLAACAAPVQTTELARIDQTAGYRYATLEQATPKAIDGTAVMLSFSGGGTRAAALADGALRALAETDVSSTAGTVPLASQIDVISSVSGGSVIAAQFALGGIEGLDGFEADFLHRDVMSALIARGLSDPVQLFFPRIGILSGYLDEEVFDHATYGDLIAVNAPGEERRPYVVLNAADMSTSSVFSFNQDQFDLICGDLAGFKLADAVAASAAFPVALSPLTIENRAPCAAQQDALANDRSGWTLYEGRPAPKRLVSAIATEATDGVLYPAAGNLADFRSGTTALSYLNYDDKADYIQLLDGGIADNLGLTLPFALLTSHGQSPSFLNWINDERIDKLLFVVVNARSQPDNDFGSHARPPGLTDVLLTTIGTPIDAISFQLRGQIADLIDERLAVGSVVTVDFDFIADKACRAYFYNMATSWTLSTTEVDDLIALGKAMVLQSPDYRELVAALGGSVPAADPSVEQICAAHTGTS
jgi:NTE family protein